MEAAAKLAEHAEIAIHPVAQAADAVFTPGTIDVLDMGMVDMRRFQYGTVSAMAGNAAFAYVKKSD